ncbi:MAG: FHA domain-containing protein [Actinomycetes bacterium]
MPDQPVDLIVTVGPDSRRLHPGQSLTIGRDADCDVVIDDRRVSRHHARVRWSDGWLLEDVQSANRIYLREEVIPELRLSPDLPTCSVRLANPVNGPVITLALAVPVDTGPAGTPLTGTPGPPPQTATSSLDIIIGRDPAATISLADPLISRHHCRVAWRGPDLVVQDLDSRNGTFVNGTLVTEAILRPGDQLSVGNTDLHIAPDYSMWVPQDATRTGLVLRDISYATPEGKVLLSGISVNAPPASVIGVIGPSGSGKSTLINVVTGVRSPASGSVWFEGHDIHREYSMMKSRIGFVPQDDLIHRQLSTRQALGYAARLRLPPDTTAGEIDARVTSIIAMLGLTEHQHKPIKKLSGGQRKRASIGLELLTQPALLVLDEPTSGLDPNTSGELMATLRELADNGHTIVVVTHSPTDLDRCDVALLLAAGGIMAGLNAPHLLLAAFGTSDWRDVYRAVSSEGGNPQVAHEQYLSRSQGSTLSHPGPEPPPPPAEPNPARLKKTRQLRTLVGRQFRLLVADRGYFIFLWVLPAGLGLLAIATPGSNGLRPGETSLTSAAEAQQVLILLILGALFAGLALSIRDLVAERKVFERERAVGLRPTAYLMSKVIVFALVGAGQALVLTGVILLRKPAPPEALLLGNGAVELYVAVLLTLWSSCALGLLISSLVRSNEQVMPVLVLAVMTELVFSGGLTPLSDRPVMMQLSWAFPSRWGFGAAADTADLQQLVPRLLPDAQWVHEPRQWLVSMTMLAVLCVIFLVLTRWRLSDPARRHRGPKQARPADRQPAP